MTPRSTNPPLTRDLVYNDLNGEEVKAILTQRLLALVASCPMFQRHLTLPRVRMSIAMTLEIFECEPPVRELSDEVVVRTRGPLGEDPHSQDLEPHFYDAVEEIDSFNNPHDQIREEHGLPVPTPTRHPRTRQTVDVMVATEKVMEPSPPPPPEPPPTYPLPEVGPGKIAATLDRGGPVSQIGMRDYVRPVGKDVIGAKNAHAGQEGRDVGVQADFRENVLKKGGER